MDMFEFSTKSIGYPEKALNDFSAKFLDEKSCQEWFLKLTFLDGISCPKCRNKITDNTTLKNFLLFKHCNCKNCNHWFITASGTILQGSHFTVQEFYLLCLLFSLKINIKEISRIFKKHPDTIRYWQKKIEIRGKNEILG